jgi:hypothetical protein
MDNNGLVLSMGYDTNEYNELVKRFHKSADWLETQNLQDKVNLFLDKIILAAERKKAELVREDCMLRMSGVSFAERKIDLIDMCNRIIEEYKKYKNQKIAPLCEWIKPTDIITIKERGIDYWIRIYFRNFYQ